MSFTQRFIIVTVTVLSTLLLLLLPALWSSMQEVRRLAEVVDDWKDSGPHSTFLGKLHERLAAAGWLAAPRDPLVECGIPVVGSGGGWKQMLAFTVNTRQRILCMEKEVLLAHEEHNIFKATFVVAATSFISWTLLLARWARPLYKHLLCTCRPTNDNKGYLNLAKEREFPCNKVGARVSKKNKLKVVFRTLHVPPRLRQRLVGPNDWFLEFLQRHYSVGIVMNNAKRKMHIKGAKQNAELCHTIVRTLVAEWQTDDPPAKAH